MIQTNIRREMYLKKIEPYIGTGIIKVLVGQRRVGKSYILKQIIELLGEIGIKKEEIIYINKEDIFWDHIKNYTDLYSVVKESKYIFIDEIQDIQEWEKCIRSLQADGSHDIYMSGSNSNMLAGELATFLSGRYINFDVYPLNYSEFLNFHSLKDTEKTFYLYLEFGELPYLKNLKLETEIVTGYLKDVVSTIILKDIVTKYRIRNIDFYKNLVSYLAKEIGTIFSAKNISDYLQSQSVEISTNIVLDYLSYSKLALFLHEVSRYDIKGKKRFELRQKYFFTDIGIRNILAGGYNPLDIGGILENIVYINLVSQGWTAQVGQIGDKEIDFIAEKNGEKIYVQVAYILESQSTIEREFGVLRDVPDNWKKYVVSLDPQASGSQEGILYRNIREFILKEL